MDIVLSYLMNGRVKVYSTIIKNDIKVAMYMLDVGVDGSRFFLKINVKERYEEEALINPTTLTSTSIYNLG